MTGMRRATKGLGLVRAAPPEAIAGEAVPRLLAYVPTQYRDAAIELAHWGYGGVAGLSFALLPRSFRHLPGAGPMFGLASWLIFDRGIAPTLQLVQAEQPKTAERLALLGDHVLYGIVVADSRDRRG